MTSTIRFVELNTVERPPLAFTLRRGRVNAVFSLGNCRQGEAAPASPPRGRSVQNEKTRHKARKCHGTMARPRPEPGTLSSIFAAGADFLPLGRGQARPVILDVQDQAGALAPGGDTRPRAPICRHCRSDFPSSLPGPGARRGRRDWADIPNFDFDAAGLVDARQYPGEIRAAPAPPPCDCPGALTLPAARAASR